MSLKLSYYEVQAAVPSIVYHTAALTSLSASVNYITLLFLKWRIEERNVVRILSVQKPHLEAPCFNFTEGIKK